MEGSNFIQMLLFEGSNGTNSNRRIGTLNYKYEIQNLNPLVITEMFDTGKSSVWHSQS